MDRNFTQIRNMVRGTEMIARGPNRGAAVEGWAMPAQEPFTNAPTAFERPPVTVSVAPKSKPLLA
jgi:hypothetical protein